MKILLINRALPVHIAGGLERHVEDLALGLAATGADLHLLTATLPEAERARFSSLGISVHSVPSAPARSAGRYTMRYLTGVGEQIRGLLARNRFDVIHAQEFALGFWRPPLGSPPLVLSVHGTITSETPLHRDCRTRLALSDWLWAVSRFGRRHIYAPCWGRHLRSAQRILVDSQFTRGELERIAPDCRGRIFQTPLAVRETAPPPASHEESRRRLGWEGLQLLTIGRLEWQKGQMLAIEALAKLRGQDWRYTIVGAGSQRRELEKLIEKLKLGSRVSLVGRVGEDEKRMMLAGADLFIWPERTHPAFGLAGLEAMLHNTPVLATPRGAIPEVLGERGGWLAEDASAASLQASLAPLLQNPAQLAPKRAGLRDWALRRFDFDGFIEAMLSHYRAAAGKNA